jgi:xanthine dehydrogenase accessory factor
VQEGVLEMFLESERRRPLLVVHGEGPVASALRDVASAAGFAVGVVDREADGTTYRLPEGAVAVVVASHGHEESEVLRLATSKGVPYVALVASRQRGPQVVGSAGLDHQVHTPAGLDIGARTPGEVAISILAELVESRRETKTEPVPELVPDSFDSVELEDLLFETAIEDQPTATTHASGLRWKEWWGPEADAIDLVCGMSMAPSSALAFADYEGRRYYFCGTECRGAFLRDPDAYGRAG